MNLIRISSTSRRRRKDWGWSQSKGRKLELWRSWRDYCEFHSLLRLNFEKFPGFNNQKLISGQRIARRSYLHRIPKRENWDCGRKLRRLLRTRTSIQRRVPPSTSNSIWPPRSMRILVSESRVQRSTLNGSDILCGMFLLIFFKDQRPTNKR